MIEILGAAAVAVLVGGMVFFPAVVAPSVFSALKPAEAGEFLRSMFPRYYLYMIVCSALAAALLYAVPVLSLTMVAIALSTLWVRQRLMPSINDARDAGDKKAFDFKHRVSVAINMVQLAAAVWVGVMLVR